MTKFTHEGFVLGCDNRMPEAYTKRVELRETKTLWVSKCGGRYSKSREGAAQGETFPLLRLDLSSIKKIERAIQ